MRGPKAYFRFALIISILFGIVLPLISGAKDIKWLIYAINLFIWVFLISGGRNLKKRLKEGVTDQRGYS